MTGRSGSHSRRGLAAQSDLFILDTEAYNSGVGTTAAKDRRLGQAKLERGEVAAANDGEPVAFAGLTHGLEMVCRVEGPREVRSQAVQGAEGALALFGGWRRELLRPLLGGGGEGKNGDQRRDERSAPCRSRTDRNRGRLRRK